MNELVEIAILAFRGARYRDAIELLLQAIDLDKDNWLALLYLGMSYQKGGRTSDAHRVFKHLAIVCPDDHIRYKAQSTMPLLDAELRRRFQKDPAKKQVEATLQDSITSLG